MKTDLSKVFTVSGEQGLFTYVAQATRGAILESMITKKRMCANASAKMSSLSDIAIYTSEGEVKLMDVFEKMKKVLGESEAPSGKSEPKALKEFFLKALPNYDEAKFYASHMKKVVEWYNCLKKYASLDFEKGEKEVAKESKESKAKEPVKEAKQPAKKTVTKAKSAGKGSSKQAAPAKSNVPRKVI